MIYLLDTNALIDMVRGLRRSSTSQDRARRLLQKCRRMRRNSHIVGVSSITVCELEHGARRSRDYDAESKAIRKILVPFRRFDFDAIECPFEYGRIKHQLDSAGTPIGIMDMLIAAHAMAIDATVVSSNVSHFVRVAGLRVESWM